MKLYQAEWCPLSHRVRAKLTELGIDYELVNVPASSKQRRDLEKVAGTTAIPVLVDGQNVITDSDEALSYLEKKYRAKPDELELHHRELSPTIHGTLPFGLMRP
jgi:glutathione S-transferase